MKEILKSSFWQLLVIYTALVVLISFGLFYKFTYHFEVFALLLGALGVYVINSKGNAKRVKKRGMDDRLKYSLLIIGVLVILILRIIPYMGNSVPIGYDSGIYKYGIDSFSEKGFGISAWEQKTFTPGFLYSMYFLNLFLSSGFLITWFFVCLFAVLGVSVYYLAREEFGERAGMISFLTYAVSVVQFKVFSFMYYKNVIALIFLVWALYFFRQERWKLFVLFGALVGLFHRPTFFIFGIGYVLHLIWRWREWKRQVILGIVIVALVGIGYIGFWGEAIVPLIQPVAQGFADPGESGGTFISFFSYQFSTLMYLPFALLGFGLLARRKELGLAWFIALAAGIIVYFQFFFFNRFIIHLDLMLILFAGFGFSKVIGKKKKLGYIVLGLMIVSSAFVATNEALNTRPLILAEDLDLISRVDDVTEQGAKLMANSGEIAPWVIAYSERETIAPGMFEANVWNREEWGAFWTTDSFVQTRGLMSAYEGEIYLIAKTEGFNNPCFDEFLTSNGRHTLYEYVCT